MAEQVIANQQPENGLLEKKEDGLHLEKCPPIELAWNELIISASITVPKVVDGKKAQVIEHKILLNRLKGVMKPGHFTAIMGPSGSGKTTLLNFLSGRLISDNLTISGQLFLNSKPIQDMDKFNDQTAYVMQDDILLATFTPKEAFMFSASLRLKVSHEEKLRKVNQLLQDLGLLKCQNTRIGNAMIRGVSGGERKRASIGVELLTNPSIIFLDEPTTGLDSSTALQVIELLKGLALAGRTVVSTIHQPSSEIYAVFDRLMLLVRGHIIFQGQSRNSVEHFKKIGFECPAYSNPSDYFMKLMNEEGLLVEKIQKGEAEDLDPHTVEEEFQQRVDLYIKAYQNDESYANLDPAETTVIKENEQTYHVSWMTQFILIFQRAFLNETRNPLDVQLKFVQAIVNALMIMIVFSDLGEYYAGYQNRNGALFFVTTTNSFGSIQGALATFSIERALFLRERINKSYSVSAYFWARSLAEFPFQVIFPTLTVAVMYYAIKLYDDVTVFFTLVFIQILVYWYGVSYGLLISILIPKVEVATALIPALIIPFMVLGGFFVNQKDIPYVFYPFEYLSIFKYGFQASVQNEYAYQTYYCQPNTPPCDPVELLGIDIPLWYNCLILFCLGLILRILSFYALHRISTPNKPELKPIPVANN